MIKNDRSIFLIFSFFDGNKDDCWLEKSRDSPTCLDITSLVVEGWEIINWLEKGKREDRMWWALVVCQSMHTNIHTN